MIFDGTKQNDDVNFEPEEQDSFEEPDNAENEAGYSEKLKKLKAELAAAHKERKEYLDGLQRAKADLLNNKKRFDDERMQLAERLEARAIMRFIPVLDSFDMAMNNNALKGEEGQNGWKAGMEQIRNQLMGILKDAGVEIIDPLGLPFDPNLHEAISTGEGKEDAVVKVVQRGYKLKQTLIRPAKVIIGRGEHS